MANKHRGEVGFSVDETDYTLRYSTNALCAMEDALDLGVNAVALLLADPSQVRMRIVRAVFWAGLTDRHPEISQADAGDIISAIGIPKALDLLGRAFALAFPEVKDGTKNPPKPGRIGTGPAS